MFKNQNLFLLTLLVSLLAQGVIWQKIELIDEHVWIKRVNNLTSDFRNNTHSFDQEKYSEHPGTPVLMLASLARWMGLAAKDSLRGALAIIISITSAWLVSTLKTIKPDSLWWLAAGSIIIFHPLYFHSSPVDVLLAPLTVLIMALIFLVVENKQRSPWSWLGLVVAIGIALSTRLHFTLIFIIPALVILTYYTSWKYTSAMALGSLVIAYAFNPLLWYTPQIFLKAALFDQIGFFTGSALNYETIPKIIPANLIVYAPLSLLSILLFLILYTLRRHVLEISNGSVLTLVVCTIFPATIISIARFQSLRYFYPLFFIWEVFLPLWLLQAIRSISLKKYGQSHNNKLRQSLSNFVVFFIVASQMIMVFYIYYLPITLLSD